MAAHSSRVITHAGNPICKSFFQVIRPRRAVAMIKAASRTGSLHQPYQWLLPAHASRDPESYLFCTTCPSACKRAATVLTKVFHRWQLTAGSPLRPTLKAKAFAGNLHRQNRRFSHSKKQLLLKGIFSKSCFCCSFSAKGSPQSRGAHSHSQKPFLI